MHHYGQPGLVPAPRTCVIHVRASLQCAKSWFRSAVIHQWVISIWVPEQSQGTACSPGSPSCTPRCDFTLCWCFPRQHNFRGCHLPRTIPKRQDGQDNPGWAAKKSVNTMRDLQPENRLQLLLLSTIYAENMEIICEICVCSFFTTDAAIGICGQQGAQHGMRTFRLGVCLTACLVCRCLPVQPHGISKQRCAGQRITREGSCTAQLWKRVDHPLRAVTSTIPILRGLAYSAVNSQAASAPQFTQKQNWDNPRVWGLCMLTWPLAGLFCFGDSPKWYYWFSASCGKCLAQLLNVWSPFMLGRKRDCRSPIHSRTERARKPFTIKRELLEMKPFTLLCF